MKKTSEKQDYLKLIVSILTKKLSKTNDENDWLQPNNSDSNLKETRLYLKKRRY